MAPILVIAAVPDELQGIVRQLEASPQSLKDGRLELSGRLSGQDVHLLATGPGLINTTRALTAAISADPPMLVIQTGCAGVFKESGLTNGDIGIATQEIDAQLGVEVFADDLPVAPLPFPILEKGPIRIQNRYPLNKDLANSAYKRLQQTMADSTVKVALGPFLTVVTVTATDRRAQKLTDAYGCLMENMEGVAAAHVCIHYDIPFLEIRSASNRVGERDKASWTLSLAFDRAAQAVCALVDGISSILPQK